MAPRKRRAPRRAASSTADSPMGEEIGEDEIMDESGDFQPSASIDGGEDLNNIGDDEEEDEGGEEEEQESMEQTLVEFLEKMESHPPIVLFNNHNVYLFPFYTFCRYRMQSLTST